MRNFFNRIERVCTANVRRFYFIYTQSYYNNYYSKRIVIVSERTRCIQCGRRLIRSDYIVHKLLYSDRTTCVDNNM